MYFYFPTRWKTVEYSRSQIIKAGKIVKSSTPTSEELSHAIQIIDNWRAAHAYPLHVIYTHLRKMAVTNPNIVVAERLKRLDSIIAKLRREPTMSLWVMQDLGGCRYIVPTLEDVTYYAEKYKTSRIRHRFVASNDYISKPKKSGYRSLHLIFEYHSERSEDYNRNMLIEIQFRTHLQHLWATAVETMGLFTKQALKAGQGSEDVKRFFALVSSVFALEEGTVTIPNTSSNLDELISELKKIDEKNHFVDMLSAIRVAVDYKKDAESNRQGYYILVLNYNTKRLQIKYFRPSQADEANNIYTQIEATKTESQIDAVLVSVSSFQLLRKAYPNYFSDIGEFVHILKKYLGYPIL